MGTWLNWCKLGFLFVTNGKRRWKMSRCESRLMEQWEFKKLLLIYCHFTLHFQGTIDKLRLVQTSQGHFVSSCQSRLSEMKGLSSSSGFSSVNPSSATSQCPTSPHDKKLFIYNFNSFEPSTIDAVVRTISISYVTIHHS